MPTFDTVSVPPPSKRQIMLATESTKVLRTNESINDQDTKSPDIKSARVEHETATRVTLWQPVRDRWIPRTIAATNMAENFEMGWRTECGACGTDHGLSEDARKGADPNACPALPKLATAYCPTCNAPFRDPGEMEKAQVDKDPDAIDLYSSRSTPETRLRAQMDLHILTYHPADAAGYGIVDTRPPVGRAMV